MNDLINDINKLQKITDNISENLPLDSIWNHNVVCALNDLKGLISEKQNIVDRFENQESNHIEELCDKLRKEYDDFCGMQNLAEDEALRRHQEENKNE
tara:strand:- start:487 stop:780 length:294 start_codon:yes stop_codon:yes gene_type:complete